MRGGMRSVRWAAVAAALAMGMQCAAGEGAKPTTKTKPRGASAAETIRKLIPRAAGMSMEEFRRIASMGQPRLEKIENQTLTSVVVFGKPAVAKGKPHFRLLGQGRAAKPTSLANELARQVRIGPLRVPTPYATVIHLDRITDFSCTVEGDRATGTVAFRAPKLYEGDADYLARRTDGGWRIEAFVLPRAGLRVVRKASGLWKMERLDEKRD